MLPRSLEEVRLEVETLRDAPPNRPIDQKIKGLVIGLRCWGVKTFGSCQGHFLPRLWSSFPFFYFPGPWPDIALMDGADTARILVELWNSTRRSKIFRWEVRVDKDYPGGIVRPVNWRIFKLLLFFPWPIFLWREAEEFGQFLILLQELPEG